MSDQRLIDPTFTFVLFILYKKQGFIVVLPGFEPRQTGPESVVLPLHHRTICIHNILFAKLQKNVTSQKISYSTLINLLL